MSSSDELKSIDSETLPRHFDAPAAEKRWDEDWQRKGVYHWDETRRREETFVVDTPPPTVSGTLHVGHVFSYTQTDVTVRYKRMRGFNTFYPMGWDDNGLPTERRVQNYYHVRCEAGVPYEPGLKLEEATKKQRDERPKLVSRANFIELCDTLTKIDEKTFLDLWRRLGLSIDWRQEYATIDHRCRKTAQYSFLDLHEKGYIYLSEAPTMWDVDFQSAVAQAEVEDRNLPGAYHHLEFGVEGSKESFTIATTRPELLPACVGVTAHPDDERYKHLFGRKAVTPLFFAPIPIFPSRLADPKKGSGILMVCTFGDQTDVLWWREQKLALRQILEKNGRLASVQFGTETFPSLRPEAANRYYADLTGKTIKQAQARMVELLADPEGSATGRGAPMVREPESIEHPVKFFEKGDRPLELLPTRQWFARLLDKKEALLEKGNQIEWHPAYMRARFLDWTNNLGLDWCLSRQRFFGVPIPVWFACDASGQVCHDQPLLASAAQLPVDPLSDCPPGYREDQRGQPGGFVGEADIFDTWFTSSLTPQIGSHWCEDRERHAKLFPADIRPQGHDIIRTWAFYTIAKALMHEASVPWKHVLLSGWILDPDRKKMSKSKGNTITPMHLLEQYSADAVRYWAASARLGVDTAFDEKIFKIGHRLVTKIYNASKFVLQQKGCNGTILCELDRAFVSRLRILVERVTAHHEAFDYAHALMETESFFWNQFTDTYIELAKQRAWGESVDPGLRDSAIVSLRLGLSVLLRLFAPVLPFVTEEVWSWVYAAESGHASIHTAPWPNAKELDEIENPQDFSTFDLAAECQAAINKSKSSASVSVGRRIASLTLAAHPMTIASIDAVFGDVLAATRCDAHTWQEDPGLAEGKFSVLDARFAE